MKRVLVTGMSGAGKSTLLAELETRGFWAVDTDYGDYFETVDGESLWIEQRIDELLSAEPSRYWGRRPRSRSSRRSRSPRSQTPSSITSAEPHTASRRCRQWTSPTP